MKSINTLIALLFLIPLFSQNEAQEFCAEFQNDNYFPLDIEKKKILWYDVSYFENIVGNKKIKNNNYLEFSQNWNTGNSNSLYLREENGVIFQYEECCDQETIRYNPEFKKGYTWQTADKKSSYTIDSYNGELKTPYCEYKNLLVIKAQFSKVTYIFYYKKGYGYVGATDNKNNLVSCVTPDWSEK